MSPSNLIIAGVAAMAVPQSSPLFIGIFVAFSAALAKLLHFYLAFFTTTFLSKERKQRLVTYGRKMKFAGPILLLLAAVSPIPDDPVVIPLGLMRYNPLKFFGIYFFGKVIITVIGAYMGSFVSISLMDIIGGTNLLIISVVSTIVITYVMMKVDLKKVLGSKLFKEDGVE
jgi:membrane protein YqaA with SNARE-associated domain